MGGEAVLVLEDVTTPQVTPSAADLRKSAAPGFPNSPRCLGRSFAASASYFTDRCGEGPASKPCRASSDTTEVHMEGQTAAEDGGEQDADGRRRERRRLLRQLLIDWSPVVAGVANLVVQHFS